MIYGIIGVVCGLIGVTNSGYHLFKCKDTPSRLAWFIPFFVGAISFNGGILILILESHK